MTAILNMNADASSSTDAHPWIAPVAVVGVLLVVAVIVGTFLLRNRTPGGLTNRKDAAVINSTLSNFTVHEQAPASTLSYEVVTDALMFAGTTLPHNQFDETIFDGKDEDPTAATQRAGTVANETYQQVDVVDEYLALSDEIEEIHC